MASNEIILPSGAIAIRQELTGKDYFQFQSMAAKAVGDKASPTAMGDAQQWLMLRAYKLVLDSNSGKFQNGNKDVASPLTLDGLEEMSFQDVSALNNDMTANFLQPAQPVSK
ncbi:MAG: hypothetical protein AAGI45_13510 [Cyanobacteria bacterium P01_H01_bin.26]